MRYNRRLAALVGNEGVGSLWRRVWRSGFGALALAFSGSLVQAAVQAAEGVGVSALLPSLAAGDSLVCIQEVAGSIPVGSTFRSPLTPLSAGCFFDMEVSPFHLLSIARAVEAANWASPNSRRPDSSCPPASPSSPLKKRDRHLTTVVFAEVFASRFGASPLFQRAASRGRGLDSCRIHRPLAKHPLLLANHPPR